MPKTASKKPIKADKLLDLDKRGLAESMVSGAKKRRGRPKKLQTLEEIKADIDRRNPTYVSPVTGGLLPGTGPKEPKKDKMKEFLTNVLQPSLIKIEENLGKILGNFDKQIETDKEKQDDLRVSEELSSEKAREEKLEKPKEKGGKVYTRVFHKIQHNDDKGRLQLESDVKWFKNKGFLKEATEEDISTPKQSVEMSSEGIGNL